jgi:hypothetical protein
LRPWPAAPRCWPFAAARFIDNGVTGQIVDTEEEAIRKLPHVLSLDRRAVRRRFEQRFSATRMAKDYIQLYRSLMQRPLLLPDGDPEIRVVRPPIKAVN